jgi:hypothetical protein
MVAASNHVDILAADDLVVIIGESAIRVLLQPVTSETKVNSISEQQSNTNLGDQQFEYDRCSVWLGKNHRDGFI